MDWTVKSFSMVTDLITCGIAATPGYVSEGVGYPFLSSTNVRNGRINWQDYKFVSGTLHRQLYRNNPPKRGDVLYSRVGTIGEAAVIDVDFEFSIYVSLTLIKPKIVLNNHFLTHLLNSQPYKTRAKQQVYLGGGVGNLNVDVVRQFPIVLPSLDEQNAIAKALSDVDSVIDSLEQLLKKKRMIKQGAMQALLSGKIRLPGFRDSWALKRFVEIAQLRKDRIDPRREVVNDFCVELEHIEQGTGCLASHAETRTSASLKSVFQKEDVLFGKLRAYLRKYWLADREGVCSTEIWVLVAQRDLVIPEFLFQIVKDDHFIEAASSAYGTHMPRSDWNVVKKYEVRLPPLHEQMAIATILSEIDEEIIRIEAKLKKNRRIKSGIEGELLTGRIRLV